MKLVDSLFFELLSNHNRLSIQFHFFYFNFRRSQFCFSNNFFISSSFTTVFLSTVFIKRCWYAGADLGFSRGGGGGFSKKIENFDDLFFYRSTKLIFWAFPKHCFAPILAKFSAPQANFRKNSQKSRLWELFEKFWQKIAFFWRALPSKLVYIGAKGAFRKILGSVGQKWISEKVSKRGPFGSAGGRIHEGGGGGGGGGRASPPKSAPVGM